MAFILQAKTREARRCSAVCRCETRAKMVIIEERHTPPKNPGNKQGRLTSSAKTEKKEKKVHLGLTLLAHVGPYWTAPQRPPLAGKRRKKVYIYILVLDGRI